MKNLYHFKKIALCSLALSLWGTAPQASFGQARVRFLNASSYTENRLLDVWMGNVKVGNLLNYRILEAYEVVPSGIDLVFAITASGSPDTSSALSRQVIRFDRGVKYTLALVGTSDSAALPGTNGFGTPLKAIVLHDTLSQISLRGYTALRLLNAVPDCLFISLILGLSPILFTQYGNVTDYTFLPTQPYIFNFNNGNNGSSPRIARLNSMIGGGALDSIVTIIATGYINPTVTEQPFKVGMQYASGRMVDMTNAVTSAKIFKNSGLVLAPNPAQNGRTMLASTGKVLPRSLELLDGLGRRVLYQAFASPTAQQDLDLSSVAPGSYAVRIVMMDGEVSHDKLML